jgi:hypothetical protein
VGLKYRPGRWPSESHYDRSPGALPQAGIAQAVGPRNRTILLSWGVAPGWYCPGRWPSESHYPPFPGALPQAGIARAVGPRNRIILLFLGRCPRLVSAGPLALRIALSSFSWGVAPGWYRPGRWPSESHYDRSPGALPQAGMARAVGPPNRIMIAPLGRCPRLVLRGPLALILGSPPVGLEGCSLSSFGQLLHEEVGHDVVGF